MAIGKDTPLTPNVIDQLVLHSLPFPIEAQEAKILLQVGQRPCGPLSRQGGESMASCISRRGRRWELVSNLDPMLLMSDD
eukprot:4525408-Pyramimonas_sp.AAC.1